MKKAVEEIIKLRSFQIERAGFIRDCGLRAYKVVVARLLEEGNNQDTRRFSVQIIREEFVPKMVEQIRKELNLSTEPPLAELCELYVDKYSEEKLYDLLVEFAKPVLASRLD